VDNVDLETAHSLGIQVLRAEGTNARGVAELTLGLMLSLVRSIPFSDERIKQGGWERSLGTELADRTLGLLGCGRIGRLVAERALAFEMRVLAHDPFPLPEFKPGGDFEFASLEALWTQADILSLHCPPLKGNRPLLDQASISQLKKGVYLINTARAGLWDEAAVLSGLESGQIAGVALDVFPEEPPRDLRLAQHPKVIALPHCGGYTRESVDRAISVAVDNLLQGLGSWKS
jgi:phosphoglycerate dehydrogenase-like enzyme